MSKKILRCSDDIDKRCHDIWLSVYTKEIARQDQQRAEELAQSAVKIYMDRWIVIVPEGRNPQHYLNSIICSVVRENVAITRNCCANVERMRLVVKIACVTN